MMSSEKSLLIKCENAWSKRQWFTLITISLATFACAICISLQAPFFPKEADKKNVRPSVYGFIFGAYSLTVFILAPIFGKYIKQIGPRFMLNSGIFITSLCCILFGLLDKINSGFVFTTYAFLIRIIEATGEAGYLTASYSIAAQTFPGHIGKSFAFLRAAFGIGLTIGPTVGGSLYELGGFALPFAVTGSFLLVITSINIGIFWNDTQSEFELGLNTPEESESLSLCKVLTTPSVFLSMISASVGVISIGFLETTLEPHLRQFELTAVNVALVFLATAFTEAVSYAFWAWFCDGKQHLKPVTAVGHMSLCCTYLLVGPAPFFSVPSQLWLSVLAMVFHGFGLGSLLLSTHVEAVQCSVQNGFPDSYETYGMISGIWAAFSEFGHFIGPSMGGILFDQLGFRVSTLIPLILQLMMVGCNVAFYLIFDMQSEQTSYPQI